MAQTFAQPPDTWAEAGPEVYSALAELQAKGRTTDEHRRKVNKALLALAEATKETTKTAKDLVVRMEIVEARVDDLIDLFGDA